MGLSSHKRACKRKQEERLQDLAYHERLRGNTLRGELVDTQAAGEFSMHVSWPSSHDCDIRTTEYS
jgi:hypothetical protein